MFTPGCKPTLIPTGLKAYCMDDECYLLLNRSSGPKKGFILANSVGLIDADYYENPDNDGHFYFAYFNCSDHDIEVKKGDVISQGDIIGKSGTCSINSDVANSLHFEIYKNGTVINPENYFDKKLKELINN